MSSTTKDRFRGVWKRLAWVLLVVLLASSAYGADGTAKYREATENMIEMISDEYPIESRAMSIAKALRDALATEEWRSLSDDASYTTWVNEVLWQAAQDLHLKVYTPEGLKEKYGERMSRRGRPAAGPAAPGNSGQPAMASGPMGELEIDSEMLDERTGLLTFSSPIFFSPERVTEALTAVADADVVIVDIRNVPGGTPPGVGHFLSHFYAEPTHYSSVVTRRDEEPMKRRTTPVELSPTFATKDVYILTNQSSASGAEALAFGFKNTQRATIVGERTAGAGNAGSIRQVAEGLSMFLPFAQAVHPTTGEPFERAGIEPDVKVPSDQALEAALAASRSDS